MYERWKLRMWMRSSEEILPRHIAFCSLFAHYSTQLHRILKKSQMSGSHAPRRDVSRPPRHARQSGRERKMGGESKKPQLTHCKSGAKDLFLKES